MAVSTKLIKTRLRSIRSTKKITKAMELVAAAKMRKTVGAVTAARPYAKTAWELMEQVQRARGEATHPLLEPRPEVKRQLIILISANRGLCGGFNAQVAMMAARQANPAIATDWIAVGRRAAQSIARSRYNLIAEFTKPDIAAQSSHVMGWVKLAMDGFLNQTYDKVIVVYTHFHSALIQKPVVKQLLPFEPSNIEIPNDVKQSASMTEYVFEPGAATLLAALLPRLIEIQAYQSLLESTASEHSARMVAMRNASDAATDMIDDLTLTYNQVRQATITREIAEISSGKAALE